MFNIFKKFVTKKQLKQKNEMLEKELTKVQKELSSYKLLCNTLEHSVQMHKDIKCSSVVEFYKPDEKCSNLMERYKRDLCLNLGQTIVGELLKNQLLHIEKLSGDPVRDTGILKCQINLKAKKLN